MGRAVHLDLEEAGSVTVAITDAGAVLQDLQVAPGWHVIRRVPTVGRVARLLGQREAGPADVVRVLVADRAGRSDPAATTWEAEVARLADGAGWEAARNRSGPGDPRQPIRVDGGTVRCDLWGGTLSLQEATPLPGWEVEAGSPADDDTEVLVRFRRGGAQGELSEVVVSVDELGLEPPLVEREHHWYLAG